MRSTSDHKPFCDDGSVNYAANVFDLVIDQNGLSIPPHLTPAEVRATIR